MPPPLREPLLTETEREVNAVRGATERAVSFARQSHTSCHAPSVPSADPRLCAIVTQLAEAATLGGAILGALHTQRQALEGAARRQREVAEELDQSSTVMQRMTRRVFQRRALWFGALALLVVAIVLVWWLRWGSADDDGGDDG